MYFLVKEDAEFKTLEIFRIVDGLSKASAELEKIQTFWTEFKKTNDKIRLPNFYCIEAPLIMKLMGKQIEKGIIRE